MKQFGGTQAHSRCYVASTEPTCQIRLNENGNARPGNYGLRCHHFGNSVPAQNGLGTKFGLEMVGRCLLRQHVIGVAQYDLFAGARPDGEPFA